jgi:hypothetical protein
MDDLMPDKLMLTGGEPLQSKLFDFKFVLAKSVSLKLYMTSADPAVLFLPHRYHLDALTFSLHNRPLANFGYCDDGTPIYLSIIASQYSPLLAKEAYERGYAGLTINEEQRAGAVFDQELPELENFTYKINRRGHCLDTKIIMPDMTVIDSFAPYIGDT